jgi:hypothetical protein
MEQNTATAVDLVDERKLKSRDVATMIGVHPKTLGIWRKIPGRGPEPFICQGPKSYVYPESAVRRWLEAHSGKLAPATNGRAPAAPADDDDRPFGVAPLDDGHDDIRQIIEADDDPMDVVGGNDAHD